MSSKSTFSGSTSKSYALALYEISKENSELNKVEEEMQNISAWYERMKQRPSAINSVHEQTSVMGLPG